MSLSPCCCKGQLCSVGYSCHCHLAVVKDSFVCSVGYSCHCHLAVVKDSFVCSVGYSCHCHLAVVKDSFARLGTVVIVTLLL